jgi:hypothetical protein
VSSWVSKGYIINDRCRYHSPRKGNRLVITGLTSSWKMRWWWKLKMLSVGIPSSRPKC